MFSKNTLSKRVNSFDIIKIKSTSNPQTITFGSPFTTESEEIIHSVSVTYHSYGNYIPGKTKVVWVCHALTGNSDVFDWWPGLFGTNGLFNPNEYFIICANVIGSSYGSTCPNSINENGEKYLQNFPLITPRDMSRIHEQLRIYLEIETIDILIGASLGGQQAIEWAIEHPSLIKQLILIATNARHSAYGIAFNEAQRQAIYNDPTFGNGNIDDAKEGLKIARAIAMISYRSYQGYAITQTDENNNKLDDFKASSYQRYQGQKLADRFNAYSYIVLSKAMDAHNVGRKRDSISKALQEIRSKTLIIGIDSDNLFPTSEQKFLKNKIENAKYAEISSAFGHDGFLVEGEKLKDIINDFLHNDFKKFSPTIFKHKKTI
ncbi:MAG: homoserine O-acetyltransferase [Flavobacteriia bacterium]|nr:homoserine O-acetyltransferase [Flavobacteriia bacterium]